MADIRVSRADARDRRLPLVSVRSGRPADGYAAAGRAPYVARLPLTQAEFDLVQRLQRRRTSAVWGGVGCVVVGLAMARFPAMFPLAVVIGLLSVVLWVSAAWSLRRVLPRVVPGPGATDLTLRGVHRRFVRAVQGSPTDAA